MKAWGWRDESGVEMREQLGGAPATSGADDAVDLGIGEGDVEVVEALLECAGVVERAAVEGVGAQDGSVAKGTEDALCPAGLTRASGCWLARSRPVLRRDAALRPYRLCPRLLHRPAASPRQMISAGPVSCITASFDGQTVRCGPPSAMAVSSRFVSRRAMAAAEEAQVPVPEEVVGPQPRS